MKKATLSILTTAIAVLAPLTAFAQEQTSIQTNANSAAAVGDANLLLQNATQANQQLGIAGYGVPNTPNAQTAVQGNINEAAAVGNYNVIGQDAVQTNTQGQVDVNQYLPPHLR